MTKNTVSIEQIIQLLNGATLVLETADVGSEEYASALVISELAREVAERRKADIQPTLSRSDLDTLLMLKVPTGMLLSVDKYFAVRNKLIVMRREVDKPRCW